MTLHMKCMPWPPSYQQGYFQQAEFRRGHWEFGNKPIYDTHSDKKAQDDVFKLLFCSDITEDSVYNHRTRIHLQLFILDAATS